MSNTPSTVGEMAVPPSISPRRVPCDGVFATAVLSATRMLATFFWARYMHYGKSLVLCDYEVGALDQNSWQHIENQLRMWRMGRSSRIPQSAVFVETEMLAAQIAATGVIARPIPGWLTKADSWNQIVQSAAAILARGEVGYTQMAHDRMDKRPFLNEAGVVSGPRGDDPTVPAFLFGVVLALDATSARDPHPRPLVRAARN
jgi:hypothetical protein